MSWSFRKRVKIAPGVHVNISKRGVSTSVGVRGASMTFDKNGTYVNMGIPGTGFYSRQKVGGNNKSTTNQSTSNSSSSSQDYSLLWVYICFIGAVLSFIALIVLKGFLWIFAILFFIMWIVVLVSDNYSRNEKKEKESKALLLSATQELAKEHNNTEKRILQNFVDCLKLAEVISEEEQIVNKLSKSGKHPDLLIEHENKLLEAKKKVRRDSI